MYKNAFFNYSTKLFFPPLVTPLYYLSRVLIVFVLFIFNLFLFSNQAMLLLLLLLFMLIYSLLIFVSEILVPLLSYHVNMTLKKCLKIKYSSIIDLQWSYGYMCRWYCKLKTNYLYTYIHILYTYMNISEVIPFFFLFFFLLVSFIYNFFFFLNASSIL